MRSPHLILSLALHLPAVAFAASVWTYLGCYGDHYPNSRTLENGLQVPGGLTNMTIENCQTTCLAAGYVLAGVEYSQECWCDNIFEDGATSPLAPAAAACTMNCRGNETEMCGGSNQLDVYFYAPSGSTPTAAPTPTFPANWSLAGCYSDDVYARTLGNRVQIIGGDGEMTPEGCVTACNAAGFLIAGVEYSDECYCDDSLHNGGTTAIDGYAQCTMTCDGNPQETCGGPDRLNLYTSGTGTGTGVAAPTTTTSTPTPTLPVNWSLVGCYSDDVYARTLGNRIQIVGGDGNMTPEGCITACNAAGFLIAGVEYSDECYCDNSLQNGGTTATDGYAQCTMTCDGNPQETCGGSDRLNLYASGTEAAVITATPSSALTGGQWSLLGCYTDDVYARVLSNRVIVAGGDGDTSVESCQAACAILGYPFAGVEYSAECYCDSTIRNGGATASDGYSQCTMPCNGNPTETCGGSNRLDMYYFGPMTTAPATTTMPSVSITTSSATTTSAAATSSSAASTATTTSSAAATSSSTAAATTTGASTATATWTPLGCYADDIYARILSQRTYISAGENGMTVELCQQACLNDGFIYSGVEYSGECYCDNYIENNGAPASDGNAQCTMTCYGNPQETCGGPNRLDLYSYSVIATATGTGASSTPTSTDVPYWLADISHQGIAPYQSSSAYKVFRNVMDYGAKGDGITDDTQAIQNAISVGNRCVPYSGCQSTTTTPALIYFPGGTYLVSRSIADYYMTHLMGNPNNMPILKATSNFNGFAIIEGAGFGSVNTFYRQVRNLVLDISAIAPGTSAAGIDWPTAQATSIQNCVFIMSDAPGTQHQGINIGSGSGGFLGDLVFEGGNQAVYFANQQFTVRNMTISNAVTAITHGWDWGWTYKTISIRNCSVGLDISSQSCGSAILIDSSITDTLVGIKTSGNPGTSSFTRGSIIVENVDFTNVATAVGDMWGNTLMAGTTGTMTVDAWGSGHEYSPNGPVFFNGPYTPFPRPPSLLSGGSYYERSKPTYGSTPASAILSVRSAGAAGNGVTDDTAAINQALQTAVADGQILFFDAGTYKVTGTIYFPGGSRVVGEAYPVIMGSGTFFSDVDNPQPVVRVGNSGESGVVEWSDMIVSTQGATAGAVLIEWNIASSASAPSGMWDVHTRIGGFAGSNLQLANCPTSQAPNTVPTPDCIAAFMSMHVTASASGLYMENVWLWTADHDIDDPNLTQISIYAGRGIYIESEAGNIWLVGAAAEHHVLYQYQLASTANVFMGQIQTETPYFQPNPSALSPFAPVTSINDPDFNVFCSGKAGNCELAWAVRILGSESIMIYGAGLYSFFSNYETTCSNYGNGEYCQTQIFGIDEGGPSAYTGTASSVYAYNVNTIGSVSMIDVGNKSVASYGDNLNVFPDTIALFTTG